MRRSSDSWQIVPYEGDSSFKKVRVRDDARVEAILRYLLNMECVALLGPPLSEKTYLLHDVTEALFQTGRFRSLYVDLWQARSNGEATFFTSLAGLVSRALGGDASPLPREVSDTRAFQNYLVGSLG